jgi:outer membrane receptor protein involved in Fe transport
MFLGAPSHKGVMLASARITDWLSVAPTVVILGQKLGVGTPDSEGNATTLVIPTQLLANVAVRVDNLPLKGLSASLGVYNIFGTDFRFVQPYVNQHLPLPGLDREVMLKVSYLFEPTYE